MNVIRTWRKVQNNVSDSYPSRGLRYDAGDWIAEILDDSWKSYTVLKRTKVSEAEWIEELEEHAVPRLPYECFSVEEFTYFRISPEQVQLEHWILQDSPGVPLGRKEQTKAPVSQVKPEDSSYTQNMRNTEKSQRPQPSSSNQTFHAQQRQPYQERKKDHYPQKRQVREAQVAFQPDYHLWTPLEVHLTVPLQHQSQVASFQNQTTSRRNSLGQPKKLPRKSHAQGSSPYEIKTHQQSFSGCQIQD